MKFKQYIDNRLKTILPQVGLNDWEFVIKVHKELLKGTPLKRERYYSLLNLTRQKADAILEKLGETDNEGNITVYSGLSVTPTNHEFIVNGNTLYTWCVVDAILFSEWLEVSANIRSNDPIDNSFIELQFEGDYLLWTKPYPLFVSWVETIDTCDIRGSLCNHVSFFASEKTANQWLKSNLNGKILTIDNFFESNKIGISCC